MNKNTLKLKIFFVFIISLFFFNAEASTCNFSANLKLGSKGEDVRCLQEFLNNSGYAISNSGIGSKGKESTAFGELTQKALMKWQEKNGLVADGSFGPKSRAKYLEINKNNTSTPTNTSSDNLISLLNSQIASLKAELATKNSSGMTSSAEQKVVVRIREALAMMDKADDEIDDASGDDKVSAEDSYRDAEENLIDSIRYLFVKKDFTKAYDYANDAYKDAEDAYDDAGGESLESEADDYIDEATKDIRLAKNKINDAEDDDKDVNQAEKLLKQAEDKLDEAKEAFDNEDFEDVEDLAEEASDLADDAIDAIDENDDKDSAKDAISDAKKTINNAEDDIDEADDDGDNVTNARKLLNKAKNKLDDAEDEYSDENYDEAKDLAKEAENLADDAVYAID
jgi:HEPN domain-containing protein